jgi:hypothetical protein
LVKFEHFKAEWMVEKCQNLGTTPQSSLAISPLRAEIPHCWKFVLPERGLVFETVGIRHIRDARQVGAPVGHVEHEKMDQTGRFKVVPAPPQF